MMSSSPVNTRNGVARRRAVRLLVVLAVAVVAGAVMTSSALALSWWIEVPPQEELPLAQKLVLGSASKVNSPFTLKWKKKFEISCSGEVGYKELYIEGHLGIGTEGIEFGKCVAKKPKNTTLIGAKVATVGLAGAVTQSGAEYPFTLSPKIGATVVAFQLEREIKPRKHYKSAKIKKCKYTVEAIGKLEGTLGEKPAEITTKKTLDFASKELTMKSSKECEYVMDAAKPARKSAAKPLKSTGLVLKTAKGALPAGAPLEAFSSNLVAETEEGNVECEENVLSGTLENNDSATDTAAISAAVSTGNFESIPDACKTSGLGPALVQWSSFPWSAAFTSKGKFAISAHAIELTVRFPAAGEVTCTFVAPQLAGINTTSGPSAFTLEKAVLKAVNEKTGGPCPAEGRLTGTFNLVSKGEPVFGELGAGGGEETKKEQKEHKEEQEEKSEEQQEVAEEEAGLPLEGNKGKVGYEGNVGWGLL
jgi:hypothetical protein